jgi:cob(I)alamin adenosyltransferase
MPIYTRTGDKGQSSLLNGERVPKNDIRIEALGTLDELNSSIGVARAFLSDKEQALLKKNLINIQEDLIKISSILALPAFQKVAGLDKRVLEFEKLIDALTQDLPPLKKFILPGGSKAGAFLHLSRAIARRAERRVFALFDKEGIDNNIIIYLNRLSDLLFTLARFVNQ